MEEVWVNLCQVSAVFSKDSKKDQNEALRAVEFSKTIDADQDFKKDEDGALKDSAGEDSKKDINEAIKDEAVEDSKTNEDEAFTNDVAEDSKKDVAPKTKEFLWRVP